MTHAARVFTVMVTVGLVMTAADHTAAQQAVIVEADLLSEVRRLRTSLEKLGGANARVQIVFGRLQLQEQRTQSAAAKLERARVVAEESDAAHVLAQEQARWSELDRQLDELERQLTIPPR